MRRKRRPYNAPPLPPSVMRSRIFASIRIEWEGDDAHWIWQAGPQFRSGGRRWAPARASYHAFVGNPGLRLVVVVCGVTGCVKPDHLKAATSMRESVARQRSHVARMAAARKISDEAIRELARKRVALPRGHGRMALYSEYAERFGLSRMYVMHLACGRMLRTSTTTAEARRAA